MGPTSPKSSCDKSTKFAWLTRSPRRISGTIPDPPGSPRGEVKKVDFHGIFYPLRFQVNSTKFLHFLSSLLYHLKTLCCVQSLPEGAPRLLEACRTALDIVVPSQRVRQRVEIPPKSVNTVEISTVHTSKVKSTEIWLFFFGPHLSDKSFCKRTQTVFKVRRSNQI